MFKVRDDIQAVTKILHFIFNKKHLASTKCLLMGSAQEYRYDWDSNSVYRVTCFVGKINAKKNTA
jgi:hypothetical protein